MSKVRIRPPKRNGQPTQNDRQLINQITSNVALMRSELLNKLFDSRRDIDDECGYTKNISDEQYGYLYDREGIGTRVVSIYPEESWVMDPIIVEDEEEEETTFEEAVADLVKAHNIWHYLHRIDELSGIGSYGVLLIGLDDGLPLDKPAEGINERGEGVGDTERTITYLRPFEKRLIRIDGYETDVSNPRYGQPTKYSLTFADPMKMDGVVTSPENTTKIVHWSRVVHIADNRKSSEVSGTPRMQSSYNRLLDLRKLLGASAEMFYKGGFPGYSFEVNPELGDVELDTTALRTEFARYSDGLQRYLAIRGVQAKSLAPQVANPAEHFLIQVKAIALTIGVPWRMLLGSEAAQLASGQDKDSINKRVKRRQDKYLTPMVVRPFFDRCIALGVLPEPASGEYDASWPDLNTPSEDDKATVAGKQTDSLAKYVAGGVDVLIPPFEYLTIVLKFMDEEAHAIIGAAELQVKDEDRLLGPDEDEVIEDEATAPTPGAEEGAVV